MTDGKRLRYLLVLVLLLGIAAAWHWRDSLSPEALNDWLQHACRMLAEDSSPSIRRAAERCDRLTWGKGMALAAGQSHLAAANTELRRRRAEARTV